MKTANPGNTNKPKKRRKWPYVVGALLVIGAIGSAMDGEDSESNTVSPQDNVSISSSVSSDSTSVSLEDKIEVNTSSSAPNSSTSSSENIGSTSQPPADPEPQVQSPEEFPAQEPAESAPEAEPEPQAQVTTATTTQPENFPPTVSSGTQNTQSRTVYITPTGKKYHYDNNCNGGTYIESTMSEALSKGLTPCKKCAGG